MMRAGLAALIGAAVAVPALGAPAAPISERLVGNALVAQISDELGEEIVIRSLKDRNRTGESLTPQDIEALDQRWRAERESDTQPLIAATLSNPLSAYLTRLQAHSAGLYTEIIVVDRNGLNVGQSTITSDYWQGDEPKFGNTLPRGAGAVFVDAPQYHEATGTWRAQVNMTIAAPQTREAIGVATVEVNLTELQRRSTL